MEARAALGLLPRDSAASRLKNRCQITGRPHGYIRRLGISRSCFVNSRIKAFCLVAARPVGKRRGEDELQ